MKSMLVLLAMLILSCGGNLKKELNKEATEELQLMVDGIRPLQTISTSIDTIVKLDTTVIVKKQDTVVVSIDSLLLKTPNYVIRKYEMVTGTLITKLAIIDYHYIRPDKFDVFQRRVYRYNESLRTWQIHKKYMLKNSLIDDKLEKYIKLDTE